jgi:hypothetical protein
MGNHSPEKKFLRNGNFQDQLFSPEPEAIFSGNSLP